MSGQLEAIVLAGGFGTRLRHIVSDVPKPMAPMDAQGTPFLSILLDQLQAQGCGHVVLSTGYMSEVIEQYFGFSYRGMQLTYSVEQTPLFTGGAVKLALTHCTAENVFVLNGDTYFDVALGKMLGQHQAQQADFTVAVKEMRDFERYGTVEISDGRITAFREKQPCKLGWINGGVYCMKRGLLDGVQAEKFSLEKDFMEPQVGKIQMMAFPSDGYFIDIGVPEDYRRAQTYFQSGGVK